MITAVTVTNLETNETARITLAHPEWTESQGFAIVNMDGLGGGIANMVSNDWVTIDGGSVNHTHIPARDISLKLQFVPTKDGETVADVRRKTYIYFPMKKKIRLTFEFYDTNGKKRERYIDGFVKQNDPDIWSKEEGCSITILCPDPYFQDVEAIEDYVSITEPLFHFEFPDKAMDINYDVGTDTSENPTKYLMSKIRDNIEKNIIMDSTVDVGGEFILESNGVVTNPYIYNTTSNEIMQFNYTMKPGESILIDTRPGYKKILSRDGTNASRLQYLMPDSKWISFKPGMNVLGIGAHNNANKLKLYYTIRQKYQGV